MLAERINNTLRFFDLQNLPLTAYEIHKFLIADTAALRSKLDENYELDNGIGTELPPVHFDTILTQLHILSREGKVIGQNGFYCLPGRESIIRDRLVNYLHGLSRERLVRRFLLPTQHIPFVRGVALAGSQALGQQRESSDIDLLIITDQKYMWIARTLLSAWFQFLGLRRHGKKIANRFCLNHYLANTGERTSERNLYTALEYAKLRPIVYPSVIRKFQKTNQGWMKQFFPNLVLTAASIKPQSDWQQLLEGVLRNRFGQWLDKRLGAWQQKRILQDQFVFVRSDELSFHPDSKQASLLQGFFKL